MGRLSELALGDAVIAVGYPVTGITVTKGIVSGFTHTLRTDLIQTDAAVNPGNSGGPLLNERGELVGIVDFRVEGGNYGLNFAVATTADRYTHLALPVVRKR